MMDGTTTATSFFVELPLDRLLVYIRLVLQNVRSRDSRVTRFFDAFALLNAPAIKQQERKVLAGRSSSIITALWRLRGGQFLIHQYRQSSLTVERSVMHAVSRS